MPDPLRTELLAAICADPDNDAPRLVYADYLLSQPSPRDQCRGQLIALQCSPKFQSPAQKATLERKLRSVTKLIPELIREDLPIDLSRKTLLYSSFHRGFLYEMRLKYAEWLRARTHLLGHAPRLGSLHLNGNGVLHPEDVEFFRGLDDFGFYENLYPYGDMIRKIMEATPDARWKRLRLTLGPLPHCPQFPSLPQLKSLSLYGREQSLPVPERALGWLAGLEQLELMNMSVDATMLENISPFLSHVSLSQCTLHENTHKILGEVSFAALYRWLADRPAIKKLYGFGLGHESLPVEDHPRIASKEIYFYWYPTPKVE